MNILVVAKRIIKQIIYDKRTLGLILVAPLLILSLVYFLFDTSNNSNLEVGVYQTTTSFNKQLKENDINIHTYNNDDNIEDRLIDDNLNAFISYSNNEYNIVYRNEDINNTNKVKSIINLSILISSSDDLMSKIKEIPLLNNLEKKDITINDKYLYLDEDMNFFDTISPILISFFVLFFVFIISGIALLNERSTKTLERMLTTPIKRSSIVLGYLLGFGVIAIIQTIIIVLYAIYILNMPLAGSIINVIVVNLLVALVALSLGTLLSTFAQSEFQMMQFIPLIIVPQIFFSGIIPIDQMADWLQAIAHVFPLYYAAQALGDIMIKGEDFMAILPNLAILCLFIITFTILNIKLLKKYRRI